MADAMVGPSRASCSGVPINVNCKSSAIHVSLHDLDLVEGRHENDAHEHVCGRIPGNNADKGKRNVRRRSIEDDQPRQRVHEHEVPKKHWAESVSKRILNEFAPVDRVVSLENVEQDREGGSAARVRYLCMA